jgi:hypothetical protein
MASGRFGWRCSTVMVMEVDVGRRAAAGEAVTTEAVATRDALAGAEAVAVTEAGAMAGVVAVREVVAGTDSFGV